MDAFIKINTSTQRAVEFINGKSKLLVLTGAGISAGSGIPTYRDESGVWLRSEPIQHQAFLSRHSERQRYWMRSFVGWPSVAKAIPSPSHTALANMEATGVIELLVTQNVDRLHQKAGHNNVIDLHGRLDQAICLGCGQIVEREKLQAVLQEKNPFILSIDAVAANKTASNKTAPNKTAPNMAVADLALPDMAVPDIAASNIVAPDGDANIENDSDRTVIIPNCQLCEGILKPNVVFFGDNVNKEIVQSIYQAIERCDGLLVIGSSLQVFSGFRFCRYAADHGVPIASINPGTTRADSLLACRIAAHSDEVLPQVYASMRK